MTIIIGAGLSGLITACMIPAATIREAAPEGTGHHKALLRFRSDVVSRATSIPFREVTVHKAIQYEGHTYTACTPRLANLYSAKVTGVLAGDRSIWDLATTKRFIAPEDFHDQLVDRHRTRIEFCAPIEVLREGQEEVFINTAPLPVIMRACGLHPIEAAFSASPIEVSRYRLAAGTDIYQTLYFPQPNILTFRASITGDLLIVERMKGPLDNVSSIASSDISYVCSSFGIDPAGIKPIERVDQKFGKIVDIPRADREAILHRLSNNFNVFSVGRFACWRNILLDDVVKDIEVVKRLMSASAYNKSLVLASRA
jgi:hypothetical protein